MVNGLQNGVKHLFLWQILKYRDMFESQKKITRREALKTMTGTVAGLAVAGTVLEGCKPQSAKAAGVNAPASASTAGKISSKKWDSLGDTVGMLGLGCMRLPSQGRTLDQEQTNAMVDYAIEHGVNYFDTAPAYGQSEKVMGVALSRHPRESYLIATKMSNFGGNPSLDSAKQMFETSLANLQVKYVDFLLLHGFGNDNDFQNRFIRNGVLDWLLEQKKAGRIRHIGFSYHGGNDYLKELLDRPYKWDFVQIQLNWVDWKNMPLGRGSNNIKCDSETLYNLLVAKKIPVVVMEPLRGGALVKLNDKITGLMNEQYPAMSPAAVGLSFSASLPGVMCTLSGMSNMDQMKENVATFTGFKPFGDSDYTFMEKLARIYNGTDRIPCTGCRYCMPCPSGVDIPANFSVYNTTVEEMNLPDPDNKDKDYKTKRRTFLNRYNNTLSDAAKASSCVNCGVCVSKCPQHIAIPTELKKISDLVKKL